MCAAGVAALVLTGCGVSASDIGGGKLTATGCSSRTSVGHQIKIRAEWTAPKIARYTLVRLDGVSNFNVDEIFDENLSHAQSGGVTGEYDLPGPQSARTKKTIVALISANKAETRNVIKISVWESGDLISALPSDAASVSCSVVVNP